MLELNNISAGYGKKQVLFEVSLAIKQGEIVLLIGSNGSGKSTVLKTVYGLVKANEGKVFFDNENITNLATANLLKRGLLYVPQKNYCFDELTVKENLEVCGLTLPKGIFKERFDYAIQLFAELKPLLNSKPAQMSGGERQMLTLACAMLHKPKMLLLDEPFTGLSPKNMEITIAQILRLNRDLGITFLIVEHNLKQALTMANKVIGLKLGKVVNHFEVKSINNENLNSIFN